MAAEIVHQNQDDGRGEGGENNAAEKQRGAIDLPPAAAQKIDRGNRRTRSEKSAQRSQQGGKRRGNRKMWLRDQRQDGTQRRTHGDAEHVRIRQRMAQQRWKTGSGDGERSATNAP